MSILSPSSAAATPSDQGDLSREELLQRVSNLAPMLKARAEQTDRDRRVSAEVIEALRATGLFRTLQPKQFGGLEFGISDMIRLNLVVGAACPSTAWCAGQAVIHNWIVALYPLEAQQEVWSDPGAIVAGSYLPAGKCERAAGGFRLSGAWAWASNCDNASWYIVGAMVPPEGGAGGPVPSWFLVPRSDATISDTWFSAGLAGTGSKTVVIDTPVFVPQHRALPLPVINSSNAPGAALNSNPLYRLTFAGSAPFSLSSMVVGMALGGVQDFTDIVRARTGTQIGGPPLALSGLPHIQLALAEGAAAVDAASTLLLRDAAELESGLAKGELPAVAQRIRNRRDHAYATKLAAQAVTGVFEALGANACMLSHPVQRAWRDVNVASRHITFSWPVVGAMYAQQQLGLPPVGSY
ncbi:MAG: acyl-CoA dehydrogenase family protein [Proteobacteria bacterium]|nr:acyl-CoA dehydrogenase family protein [Pseudomonadota bacterium]